MRSPAAEVLGAPRDGFDPRVPGDLMGSQRRLIETKGDFGISIWAHSGSYMLLEHASITSSQDCTSGSTRREENDGSVGSLEVRKS